MRKSFKKASEAERFFQEMDELYNVSYDLSKPNEIVIVWHKMREFFRTEELAKICADKKRRDGYRKVKMQKSDLPSKPNHFMVTWCKKAKK